MYIAPMLKFLSINCNGLRDGAKVDVLSLQCGLLSYDFLLLQETHKVSSDEGFLVAEKLQARGFWSLGTPPPIVAVLQFSLTNALEPWCPGGTRRGAV